MYIGTAVPAAFPRAATDVGEVAAAGRNGLLQLIVRRVEEVAGRGDLRDRRVVGEHQLGVDVRVLARLVVTHRAEAVAALGALVVVERAEVVRVRIARCSRGTQLPYRS